MQGTLHELLRNTDVCEPTEVDRLQIFGLRWEVTSDLPYTTLDEALAAETVEVTEISESGSVPELRVVNRGSVMLFLLAGEQLIGAKQDRVVNASIMVPADSELQIPVSCVEAGRWGYRSRQFGSKGSSSHGRLLGMMSLDTLDGYRKTGKPSSDQRKVWHEVDRKLFIMKLESPSRALADAYRKHCTKLLKAIKKARVPEDCSGVAFVLGGRVVGAHLFDKPSTLSKLLPKLVKAYVIDAMEESEPPSAVDRESVRKWLQSVAATKTERFPSPGLGTDLRFADNDTVGASLIVEECPVHTAAFARVEEKPR